MGNISGFVHIITKDDNVMTMFYLENKTLQKVSIPKAATSTEQGNTSIILNRSTEDMLEVLGRRNLFKLSYFLWCKSILKK